MKKGKKGKRGKAAAKAPNWVRTAAAAKIPSWSERQNWRVHGLYRPDEPPGALRRIDPATYKFKG